MVTVEFEAVGRAKGLAQGVKVSCWDLECSLAHLAREMRVDRSGQVINGRTLAEVGMDDDPQLLELFKNAVNSRLTHFGVARLNRAGQDVRGQVPANFGEHLGDCPFRGSDAMSVLSNRRQQGIDRIDLLWHNSTLRPRGSSSSANSLETCLLRQRW